MNPPSEKLVTLLAKAVEATEDKLRRERQRKALEADLAEAVAREAEAHDRRELAWKVLRAETFHGVDSGAGDDA